jgi:hypothetical protein
MRNTIIVLLLCACEPDQNPDRFGPSLPPIDAAPDAARPDASIDAAPPDAFECTGGLKACGLTCSDLSSDTNNCGACGHSCRGTSCNAGLCGFTVLAQNQGEPAQVVVNATHVFWANGAYPPYGAVMRLDKSMLGTAPVAISNSEADPVGLALDATSVYWINRTFSTPGTVRQAPLLGGSVATLASNEANPSHIVLANGYLVWTDSGVPGTSGSVVKRSLAGGAPTTLVTNVSPEFIVADATAAYFTNTTDYVIESVPLAGGTASNVVGFTYVATSLALYSDHLYWSDEDGLRRISLTTHITDWIYSGGGLVMGLAIDGTSVYFLELVSAGGSTSNTNIRRQPLGGNSSLILATVPGQLNTLAVDDDFVYWGGNGVVARVAK